MRAIDALRAKLLPNEKVGGCFDPRRKKEPRLNYTIPRCGNFHYCRLSSTVKNKTVEVIHMACSVVKILVVGAQQVGKSSLLQCLNGLIFDPVVGTKSSIDFAVHEVCFLKCYFCSFCSFCS